MEKITDNYLFGILVCVACFYGIAWLRDKLRKSWINPLLLSIILIIVFLTVTRIPFGHFMKGAGLINAFLGPVTVVLALPLYRQRKLLLAYKEAILGGILAGVFSALISVIGLCRILGLNELLERSLLSHSVTTPIGVALSELLGASEGLTVLSIIITGLFGAVIAPTVYRLLKIVHPVAKGIGLGTAAHALGTTKAIEMGETEGAMSGLAIGVTALATVIAVILFQAVL